MFLDTTSLALAAFSQLSFGRVQMLGQRERLAKVTSLCGRNMPGRRWHMLGDSQEKTLPQQLAMGFTPAFFLSLVPVVPNVGGKEKENYYYS